ncbi:hypothetical protein ALC62_07401, partial [Cyphomyrmex costatus]
VFLIAIPYCRVPQVKLTRSTVDQVDEWQLRRVRDRNNRVIEALTLARCYRTIKVVLALYRNVRQVSIVASATVCEVVLNLSVQHDALREVCCGTCSTSKCAHREGCFRLQLRHQRRVLETGDPLLYLGRQCGLIRGAGQIAGTPSVSAERSFLDAMCRKR